MTPNPAFASTGRRSALAAGLLLVVAVALTACTSAVNGPAGPSSTPKRGGTLAVAVTPDAQPGAILGGYESNWPWLSNVFETLVRLDPKTAEPKPLLAARWKVAGDGLSINITLRDDVTFQTGRKMTADDVKFSIEKGAAPVTASQVGFIARQFTAINVMSPTTLTITFAKPLSNIFDFFGQTSIVDKNTYAGLADGSQVIGTGPYKFVSWNPRASYTLKRYDGYRDKKAANFDTITYDVITNSTAELSAIRSGRDQIAYGLATTDTQGFANNKQYTVIKAGGTIYPFGMNVTVAPFDNKEVRQAVAYAIDRKRINQQVFQNTGTVTDLFWGPNAHGYTKKLADQYTYDPAKAKKMIEDAGATGAQVPIVYMSTPIVGSIFEIFANNLKAIGLKPTAVPLDSPTFIARQIQGDLGAAFLSTHGQVGRGPSTLIGSLPTLRKGNPSQFWSSNYDQLRNNLLSASTTQASSDALQALSSYMLDQAFVMSIVQAPKQIVISSKVQGIQVGLSGELFAENGYLAQ